MRLATEREKAMVESAGITNVGRKRKGNEDSYFIDESLRLYVVADGMGGHQAGEVASKIVAETIQKMMNEYAGGIISDNNIGPHNLSKEAAWLDSSIIEANRLVHDLSKKVKEYRGMGATVSAVFLTPDTLIAANVGDSPIYLIRKEEVSLLSVPHTAMAEYEAFAPAGSKALSDKFRHTITRAMGNKESVDPDFREITPITGDIVVLCSDGLSDKVKPEEIADIVKSNPPAEACRILVDLANERGGDDNITIIILKILEAPGSRQVTGNSNASFGTEQESVQPVVVEYDTEDFSGRVLVRKITTAGLFVETAEFFTAGQKVVLTVSDINGKYSIMANAKVAGINPRGAELKFDKLTQEQKEKLEHLVKHLTV
ncbi:MAG: protein phosphatase 2C domain-containing protein [Proteobacteria bacterium]|nr:protein phosphatase 2C domain-containing protein [Pseudomonadota bacterium]